MIHLGVISALPDMFSPLTLGVTGKAITNNLAKVDIFNLRDYAKGHYRRIDDSPFGGGPGMVMMVEPLDAAVNAAKGVMPKDTKVIYLSPQGRQITQTDLNSIAAQAQSMLWIAGRYEGIDERIIEHVVDEEWSLGDFVLSGGELAAMVYIDAIIRLLPGVLGHNASAIQDSFMSGLLDTPHYTRPAKHHLGDVPEVLCSGDHQAIERWRLKQALGQTWLKRPDLLAKYDLNEVCQQLLLEFKNETGN
jgi:tRNA (guanine37-N1)-methyltransferase